MNKLTHILRSPQVAFLALVTFVALLFVPDLPTRHLDDPSHWGVLGFLGVAGIVAVQKSWDLENPLIRGLFTLFLAGLPVIYVANWLRWGGSTEALWLELLGLAFWMGLAVLSRWRTDIIWIGVGLHAVWDAFHFGNTEYVPDWYIIACIAADLGLAGFLLTVAAPKGSRQPAHKQPLQ
ncbi:hypothetical protein [Leisingera sp. McT4-56]|uniref:hypothetical protein n=1 Tax=Leisingera sp. McT4-56 TaxID=2881255 RepID=UPI001CF84B81|nr:hypothetical protein [Leisingera sp. McT4-56]MCB4458434.1 hypothetical protein [Leisingera sp. McT4-56]